MLAELVFVKWEVSSENAGANVGCCTVIGVWRWCFQIAPFRPSAASGGMFIIEGFFFGKRRSIDSPFRLSSVVWLSTDTKIDSVYGHLHLVFIFFENGARFIRLFFKNFLPRNVQRQRFEIDGQMVALWVLSINVWVFSPLTPASVFKHQPSAKKRKKK